jgi:two-component system cell cycle sensor histidine kinase/response regulator CckA
MDERTGHGEGKTILLADDTPDLVEMLHQLLEAAGYRVLCAASGELALEILRSHLAPIDILLTDMIMPEVSGEELMAAARQLRPAIRVVIMSGGGHPALAEGAEVQCLQKPFSGRQLLDKLRETP